MAEVRFEGVTRRYGGAAALDDLSCVARSGGFTVFTGPPGCGKSVLLRLLVGLEYPDEGRVLIDGADVTETPPAARPVGYVPQSFALYPHLSVRKNIAYPLTLAGAPSERIEAQVAKAASLLSIEKLLDKTPDQLSGGEKQRVAVARGLSKDAQIFVLDDPLVGLDYKLRERLMADLKALRVELGATFLYATSDPLEVLTMAQDLVVIEDGRLVQSGPVEAVYAQPERAASLRLVGFPRANLVRGRWSARDVEAGPFRFPVAGMGDGRAVTVGVRPEAMAAANGAEAAEGVRLEGEVALVEDLGGEQVIYVDCAGETLTVMRNADSTSPMPALGDRLALAVDPGALIVFDGATGERLATGGA
jgi:ABC-type sugar transport system ATPase subunit